MKTLLLALLSPGKSRGTREGAIRGLIGVGKEAVRKGLVEGGGAKVVGSECEENEVENATLVVAVMVFFLPHSFSYANWTSEQDALQVLKPTNETDMADALDTAKPEDAAIAQRLCEVVGNLFAGRVADDAAWAREVLGISTGS